MKVIVQGIPPGAIFGRPPTLLFHYTSQEGLLGIISSKSVWASHSAFLNDARELEYAIELAREEADVLRRIAHGRHRRFLTSVPALLDKLRTQSVFVFSLSEHGDLLSQWRAYATGGRGCSIGFPAVPLRNAVEAQDFFLAQCIYTRAAQTRELRRLFRLCFRAIDAARGDAPINTGAYAFALHFMPLAARLKDPSFHEEKEWRLISSVRPAAPRVGPLSIQPPRPMSFRPGPSTLVPYYVLPLAVGTATLPIRRIIAGPTPAPDRSYAALKSLLQSVGLSKCEIGISDIPFRSW